MNREIKYRVRHAETKEFIGYERIGVDGHWEFSRLGRKEWLKGIITDGQIGETHIREQSTGLHDKNGAEIYEGDVVRILYTDWASKSSDDPRTLEQYLIDIADIGSIVWDRDRWMVQFYSEKFSEHFWRPVIHGKHGYIEVIGNIHQNKDLLK